MDSETPKQTRKRKSKWDSGFCFDTTALVIFNSSCFLLADVPDSVENVSILIPKEPTTPSAPEAFALTISNSTPNKEPVPKIPVGVNQI
jgi:hypothetical protein